LPFLIFLTSVLPKASEQEANVDAKAFELIDSTAVIMICLDDTSPASRDELS
jgi:hypothetical protein